MLTVSQPHWVCPHSRHVYFPCQQCLGSRLLCWELSEAGPGLYALSRSKPLRFRYSGRPQRHRFGWACVLCPSQVPAAQVTRCLESLFTVTYHLPHPCRSVFWVYNRHTFSGRCSPPLFLGSLVQSHCREVGTLQTNNTGVCLQCLSHTGFVPAHGVCAFPVYTA